VSGRGRRWRNAELVRERDAHSVRRLWLWVLIWFAALSPMGVYLFEQIHYARVRIAVEDLRDTRDQLAERERRLRIDRSALETLERVEKRASALGLEYPDAARRIQVLESPGGDGLLAHGAEDRP